MQIKSNSENINFNITSYNICFYIFKELVVYIHIFEVNSQFLNENIRKICN